PPVAAPARIPFGYQDGRAATSRQPANRADPRFRGAKRRARLSQKGPGLARRRSRRKHNERTLISMHIIWSLIVVLVVGAIAKLLMPGKDPGGILITMVLGLVGAVVAGFLGRA